MFSFPFSKFSFSSTRISVPYILPYLRLLALYNYRLASVNNNNRTPVKTRSGNANHSPTRRFNNNQAYIRIKSFPETPRTSG